MKEFSKSEIAVIKRTAQNVQPLLEKREVLKKKMNDLQILIDTNEMQINVWEDAIRKMTDGFGTQDLVEVTKKQIGEKDGKPIYGKNYQLKYPETVIPSDNKPSEGFESTFGC